MFSLFPKQKQTQTQNQAEQVEKTNYARGVDAEQRAINYLIEAGYTILSHRYKTKFGEVDVIAMRENTLCFIEVKMRQDIAGALEAVTPRSRRRIEQSALHFMMEKPEFGDCDMRFDVIAITKPFQITHLDNAWLPEA